MKTLKIIGIFLGIIVLFFMIFLGTALQNEGGSGEKIGTILYVFAILLFYFWLLSIVFKMANKRNRSQLGWLLFSIIINPVLALIILSFLGEKKGVFA